VLNIQEFEKPSIKLSYFKEKVEELNMIKLKALNEPRAIVKAHHSNGAHNLSSDDVGGLEPILYLARGARVILKEIKR